jgi:hypothetical protein
MNKKLRIHGVAVLSAVGLAVLGPGSVPAAAAPPTNMAIRWNATMLAVFQSAGLPAPAAIRLGAIVQAAVFDAVNGIEGRYTPIHVQPAAPDDASPKAAVAAAAYEALSHLVAGQGSILEPALASSIDSLDEHDAEAVAAGIAWGTEVADEVLAWRAADGFGATPPPYNFDTTPGQWQPTPGGTGAPKFRTLATTQPFALNSPSQLRPAGPPALTSARYTRDFNEVKSMGGLNGSGRTPYQTETATFWQVDTPVAMWDRVADTLAYNSHFNLLRTARLLAQVNIATADALIAVFDAKNAFNAWRPVTAIVEANLDGNPDTDADSAWLPPTDHALLPGIPVSSLRSEQRGRFDPRHCVRRWHELHRHVCRSARRAAQLHHFSAAVAQIADARVLAGFHFRFSCDDASVMGRQTAGLVMSKLMLQVRD